MKRSHITALVIIGVAIAIIITTAGDASTYVTFDQAYAMASSGDAKSIHVVGELKKDFMGEVTELTESPDKLSFSFVLVDESGKEQIVTYNEPIPPDFIRSEKVVVIGSFRGDSFVAEKILLKCPSKYQEQSLNAGV